MADFLQTLWFLSVTAFPMPILSSLQAEQTFAVPLPRWMEPCRGTTVSNQELLVYSVLEGVELDLFVAHRLWSKVNDVLHVTDRLRRQLARERIESEYLRAYLENNATLTGFPDPHTQHGHTEFVERLRTDLRKVTIATIYVVEMRRDEESSSFSPNYAESFRQLESHLYPLLCQLQLAVIRTGSSLPLVTRDIIDASVRNSVTIAERHFRDYCILRGIIQLLQNLQKRYGHVQEEVITYVEKRYKFG